MKLVYALEFDCDIIGVYETREEAMLAGLCKYTEWLNSEVDRHKDNPYPTKQVAEDLSDFFTAGYMEDYIYVNEVPYYGSDNE